MLILSDYFTLHDKVSKIYKVTIMQFSVHNFNQKIPTALNSVSMVSKFLNIASFVTTAVQK